MKSHPYLRAYMAGTTVPNVVIVMLVTVVSIARFVWKLPYPIEQIVIFPIAAAPNLFGIWNIVYVALRPERRLPIGVHGALLPFIIGPFVLTMGTLLGLVSFTSNEMVWFDSVRLPYAIGVTFIPIAVAAYYLIWKHIVGFLNAVLGVA